jgi:hypothetical protein
MEFPDLSIGRHGTGMAIFESQLWTSCGSYKKGGGPELGDIWKISIE